MFMKRLKSVTLALAFAAVVGSLVESTPQAATASETTGGIGLSVQDGQVLSRNVSLYAGGGNTKGHTISVDSVQLPTQTSDSPPATITFHGKGIQATQNLEDSVWVNGKMVTVLHEDIDNWDRASVSVPAGYLQPGSNAIRIRSGDSVSPTDLVNNHDDFSVRNVQLILPNGKSLTDPNYSDTQQVNIGDGYPGGNATDEEVNADFTMTATAGDLDGVVSSWNTTEITDGQHTITATGTDENGDTVKTIAHVQVDNTPPLKLKWGFNKILLK